MNPVTCWEDSPRSIVSVSPATVTLALIGISSESNPSSSTRDSPKYSPSGQSDMKLLTCASVASSMPSTIRVSRSEP